MNRSRRLAQTGAGTIVAGIAIIFLSIMMSIGARAASTGTVNLLITLSDSQGGQFAAGSLVTITATIVNSLTSSVGDATPTLQVTQSVSALSFVSVGPGWSCSTGVGAEQCVDGTLSAGGSTTAPLVFSVVGSPCFGASVTETVSDSGAENVSSSANTATDSASIANPASYNQNAPAQGFPTKVQSDQIVSDSTAVTMTFTDGANVIRLGIPGGSLPVGTHVTIYKANSSFWSGSLSSSSQQFVDGYAAAWTPCGGTASAAASSITLAVSDASASSGQRLYKTNISGLGSQTGIVSNGGWVVSFTDDPGFILGRAPAVSSSSSGALPAGAIPSLPSAGFGGKGAPLLVLVLGITLVVAGTVVVGLRRRPA